MIYGFAIGLEKFLQISELLQARFLRDCFFTSELVSPSGYYLFYGMYLICFVVCAAILSDLKGSSAGHFLRVLRVLEPGELTSL